MKTILAVLITASALIATLSHGMEDDATMAGADIGKPSDFILISGDVECRLSQGAIQEKASLLKLDTGCTGAGNPAAQATLIEQNDDGSIDLLKQDGTKLVRFGAPEGDTHVSYEPQSPLIRLVAVD